MSNGKPKCKLTGTDGNVFAIIARVAKCLREAKLPLSATEFRKEALEAESYDAVLVLCFKYVDVR